MEEQNQAINLPPSIRVSKWSRGEAPGKKSAKTNRIIPKWKHSEPERNPKRYVDELIGEYVDGVIVAWRQNSNGLWSGFIRPNGYGSHGDKNGLFVLFEDVLSDIDPATIRPGTRARFKVGPARLDHNALTATEVDIYIEQFEQGQGPAESQDA